MRFSTMVATRFAVAVHVLLLLACARDGEATTSLRLAQSVNTNPAVVRRITGLLARAGLIRVRRGPGGAALAHPPGAISLADVWAAVNPGGPRPLLPLHEHPSPHCPVGRSVHAVLGQAFGRAETALQDALRRITLDALVSGVQGTAHAPELSGRVQALTGLRL